MMMLHMLFATGALPENPDLKLEELSDIRVLDALFRAHVLLAEIVGRSAPQYRDYLVMAHTYLMRIWQVRVLQKQDLMRVCKLLSKLACSADCTGTTISA